MPKRSTVTTLPNEQREFVIEAVNRGQTNKDLCADFEKQFNKKLSVHAVGRWRRAAGDELAERYRLARFRAREQLQDLKQEDPNKYEILMANIEDCLLTTEAEIISQDPLRLLAARQKEEDRRLRQRALELRAEDQRFRHQQQLRAEQLQVDRLRIAAETWRFILFWLKDREAQAVDVMTRRSEELIKALGDYMEGQQAVARKQLGAQ
jgi:hypothetical protein